MMGQIVVKGHTRCSDGISHPARQRATGIAIENHVLVRNTVVVADLHHELVPHCPPEKVLAVAQEAINRPNIDWQHRGQMGYFAGANIDWQDCKGQNGVFIASSTVAPEGEEVTDPHAVLGKDVHDGCV